MDDTIFKKMKVKPGMTVATLYAPPEYPNYEEGSEVGEGKADFVHLFVTSKHEFTERLAEAADRVTEGGLFWISYPKSAKGQKYDINRNILWDLAIPLNWHPVAQVSLSEEWSAMRLKPNAPGVEYERPGKKK